MTRASRLRPFVPVIFPLLHTSTPIWALRASAVSFSNNLASSYPVGFQPPAVFSRNFSTTTMASATFTKAQLKHAFSPAVLQAVRDFWFHDLTEEELIIPPMDVVSRWFRRSEEFDQACFSNFGEQIEIIKSPEVTITDIISATNPSSPLDWLSLVLLLDQITRNVFRDASARIVFAVTDPKALELARLIIGAGIPQQSPVAYRMAYRFWFYLPLEHSEELDVQVQSVREHEGMFRDLKGVVGKEVDCLDEDTRRCCDVLREKEEVLESWAGVFMGRFVLGHKELIDRFGRFPHRNEVLGRESTAAEIKFLEGGGETFGGKKEE